MAELFTYRGVVKRVVDGDTVDAELDLGFGIKMHQRFRIMDIDTPETYRPKSEAEKIHGQAASKRANELLMGETLIFKSTKVPQIYGRYGAIITLPDGQNFATVMISEGFQKKDNYENG